MYAEADPIGLGAVCLAILSQACAQVGERPALGELRGVATLTRREREVASLAAGGSSNREIAERLVVSVRTVEHHLEHAYEKLGVNRRSQLAQHLGIPFT